MFWLFYQRWFIMSSNDVTSVIIFVFNQGTGKWYEMQDLQVTDILPQMITLSEAYIQVRAPTHSVQVGKCKYCRALAPYLPCATWNDMNHILKLIFKGETTS